MADGRILGMPPRTALIVTGGAAAAGIVYFWWRRRQQPAAAGSAASTGCTDGQGNAVPCPDATGIDYSGELSVIQSELEGVLADEGHEEGGTGTGAENGKPVTTPPGTPPPKVIPGMPANVKSSAVTKTGFTLSWGAVKGATSYQVRVTNSSKLVHSATVSKTSATVTGLGANKTYTAHVKACNQMGCSAETNGPTVKTSR